MYCTSTLKSWLRFALLASPFAILTNNFNAFGEGKKSEPVKRDKATQIQTESPIKHVIVLIGENRTFDHVFGTYVPKKGETISNLLSKGIVNADGTPGPNFSLAQQFEAIKPFQTEYPTPDSDPFPATPAISCRKWVSLRRSQSIAR